MSRLSLSAESRSGNPIRVAIVSTKVSGTVLAGLPRKAMSA
jgi:hypothetical protein